MLDEINALLGKMVSFNLDAIFFDLETANIYGDISQIGAIVINKGKIVKIIDEYCNPIGKISKGYSEKTGITNDMVLTAPSFKEIWESEFSFFNENYILVAHNAATFDIPNLAKNLNYYGINIDKTCFYDSFKLTKQLCYPIKSFSRESLCHFFGFSILHNHSALSDAYDCFRIFCKVISDLGGKLPQPELRDLRDQREDESKYENRFLLHKGLTKAEREAIIPYEEADLDFKGKKIVVSGIFQRFPQKQDAQKEIEKRGGNVISSVSSKTQLLICGKDAGPSKIQKAKEMKIRIVDEDEFYKMLESNEAV